MAQLTDLNMDDVEELRDSFTPLPPGDYNFWVESSEIKDTKAGTGKYLEFWFVVSDGEHEGKKVVCRLNLWNPNADAVRIAKPQFEALCQAIIGQPAKTIMDSSQLHSRLFTAEVANVPRNDDPSKRTNELVFRKGSIRKHGEARPGPAHVEQAAGAQQAPQPTTAAPAAAAPKPATATPGVGKAPWKNK